MWEMMYPLVNVYITMENQHFQWVNPLYMVIFNSYVTLPEGMWAPIQALQVTGLGAKVRQEMLQLFVGGNGWQLHGFIRHDRGAVGVTFVGRC